MFRARCSFNRGRYRKEIVWAMSAKNYRFLFTFSYSASFNELCNKFLKNKTSFIDILKKVIKGRNRHGKNITFPWSFINFLQKKKKREYKLKNDSYTYNLFFLVYISILSLKLKYKRKSEKKRKKNTFEYYTREAEFWTTFICLNLSASTVAMCLNFVT